MATLLEIAEELYGLEPAEFTAARDARAKELKGTPLGAEVKGLRKASTAAWVVDQLVRHEAEQVDQVVALGAALRDAQEGMDAAQLRELTQQRRMLTRAVTARARELAEERGVHITDAVAEQVESTLTAAMIDPEAARAVRSGLLVGTLTATGLGPVDTAAAVAAPDALGFEPLPDDGSARRHLRAVPDLPKDSTKKTGKKAAKAAGKQSRRDEDAEERARAAAARELAAAREAFEEADEDVAAAHEQHDGAETEVGRLEERSSAVSDEIEELRTRLADLEHEVGRLRADLRVATKVRDRAARFLADANRRREEAVGRVQDLESGG